MVVNTALSTGKTDSRRTNSFARHLPTVGRILMGILFFVFGLFGLLTYLRVVPQPPAPMPAGAKAFTDALTNSGYMIPLSSGTELIVGVLLLSNRFVPLALTLIAPIIVNIFLFHAVLAPSGLGMTLVLAAIEIYLAWVYREAFRSMLAVRTIPA